MSRVGRAYRHLLFDIDGTLLDSAEAVYLALEAAVVKTGGPPITRAVLEAHFGMPGRVFLRSIGQYRADDCFECWCEELAARQKLICPYPGIVETLNQLQAWKLPMAVITSRTRSVADPDLQSHRLLDYFSYVICSEDTPKPKPAPDPLLHYLQLTGARAEECLYLGDTLSDYECARDAGVDFALAGWGACSTAGMETAVRLSSPLEIPALADRSV